MHIKETRSPFYLITTTCKMFLAANAVKILEHKYQRAECSGFLEDLEQVQKVTSSVDSTTTWIKLNYVHQLGSDFSKSTN